MFIQTYVYKYHIPIYCTEKNGTTFCDEDAYVEESIFSSGKIVVFVLVTYLAIALKLGKMFMENRQPMKIRSIMQFYNIFQVVFNVYMVLNIFYDDHGVVYWYHTICHPPLPTTFPGRLKFLFGAQFYLVAKYLDLLDTVFMIVRKKYSHITYLHLFHHTSMVIGVWFTLVHIRGEIGLIFGSINNLVHVIMYSYFYLTARGVRTARIVAPIKPYITKIQIGQFIIILTLMANMYAAGCKIPPAFVVFWFVNVAIIMIFFINFYIKSYIYKPKIEAKKEKQK